MTSKACGWCAPKPHLPFIADNNGFFSDFDCDLSYGLGVCGGCGGLGIQVENEDFSERAKKIMHLRFVYCPTDTRLPTPPMCLRLRALKELKKELAEHYQLYGEGRESYAKYLLDTKLDQLVMTHEQSIEKEVERYTQTPDPSDEQIKTLRQALLASVRGDLDQAESLFRERAEQMQNSIAWHDLGTFFGMYRRDVERTIECYKMSCTLEPKKTLHFFELARILLLFERNQEAIPFLRQAIECEDFAMCDESITIPISIMLS
jgi:tetratricopeptide (TPR) repeat protein